MKKIISVKNLTKNFKVYHKKQGLIGSLSAFFKRKYETVKAVQKINFEMNKGEIVGFIGPNGAGKTTTLKMLSGLLHPDDGEVSVLGFIPFKRKKDFLSQISLVMGQKSQLWWDLPAIESFNLNRMVYNLSKEDYKTSLASLVEMLDAKDIIHRQVRKLSLGQRMKCELIASLIHNPKILFLDEPTIGLDVVIQKKLRKFIKEYNEKYNATIILTSHYIGDLEELCKRVVVINDGILGYDGDFGSLIKKYAKLKTIKLVFLKEVKKENLQKYGKIIDFEPLKASLEVNREKVGEVASGILNEFSVDDLNISEMPIEEVVRRIFENGNNE
ncbi:ATP-binding cassette domain-containing protein [Candidatus Parcubacteria bacterium]|nr:ATP-binding cassette domain-containing protein [Candidatus Parcubacteria bacterium]